jgi:hypothetical protein
MCFQGYVQFGKEKASVAELLKRGNMPTATIMVHHKPSDKFRFFVIHYRPKLKAQQHKCPAWDDQAKTCTFVRQSQFCWHYVSSHQSLLFLTLSLLHA